MFEMAARYTLIASSGLDTLQEHFDPDCQPMLPLVEIPWSVNPYYDDGVRIYQMFLTKEIKVLRERQENKADSEMLWAYLSHLLFERKNCAVCVYIRRTT